MRRIVGVILLIVLASCSNDKPSLEHDQVTVPGPATAAVTVSSPVLTGAAPTVPVKYTCDGANTSFPLQWAAPPSVAVDTWTLRIDDPDAPGGGFVHWVVEAIPASTTKSDEGASPAGGTVKAAYRGPCPPKGSSPHHYVITVTGIRGGNEVAKGTLIGTYRRG